MSGFTENNFGGRFELKADQKLYPLAPVGCFLDDAGNVYEPVPRVAALVTLIEGLDTEQESAPVVIRKRSIAASEG